MTDIFSKWVEAFACQSHPTWSGENKWHKVAMFYFLMEIKQSTPKEQIKIWWESHWQQPHCRRQSWLFVPAVKQGRTRKLSLLWCGPYTIIDKISVVTYWIQLIESPKTLVVHMNILMICYGELQGKPRKKQPTAAQQKRGRETACPNPTSPPATPTSKLTYAKVIANQQETQSAGGYTTSSNELSIGTGRPQCSWQPPVHYG